MGTVASAGRVHATFTTNSEEPSIRKPFNLAVLGTGLTPAEIMSLIGRLTLPWTIYPGFEIPSLEDTPHTDAVPSSLIVSTLPVSKHQRDHKPIRNTFRKGGLVASLDQAARVPVEGLSGVWPARIHNRLLTIAAVKVFLH